MVHTNARTHKKNPTYTQKYEALPVRTKLHARIHANGTYMHTQRLQLFFHKSPIETDRTRSVSVPRVTHRPEKEIRDAMLMNVHVIVSFTLCVFLHLLAGCYSITPESQLVSLSLTLVSSGPACSYMLIVVSNDRRGFGCRITARKCNYQPGGLMWQNLRATHP